ncbi:zinc finger MYM-type protein 1 [Trichonephila clavipes]|nr:zinc finger MYM-type protein 1 [Trichonephila clavipes]
MQLTILQQPKRFLASSIKSTYVLFSKSGTILREGENSDIQPFELYEELQLLKTNSLDSINDAKQLIQYILENNLEEIYPNIYITIRIMLIVPVSTASAERSFSKLKLIKTYLRNTMSQERLSALSFLSIEAEIAASVSYDIILKKFKEEFLGVSLTPPKRVTHFPRLEEGNVPINTSWYGMFWEFPAFWGSHGPREDIPPPTPDQSEKPIVFRERIPSRIQR